MKKYFVNSYDKIADLSEIVLSGRNNVRYCEPKYSSIFSPNKVIDFAGSFFSYVNPCLGNLFYDKLYEKSAVDTNYSVHFIIKNNTNIKDSNCLYPNGNVDITLGGTIKDIITIVHEMTHKFFTRPNKWGIICHLLAEFPSLTMELILFDYVKKLFKENKIEEIVYAEMKIFMEWRFSRTIIHARSLLMNCELIRLYKNNNNHVDGEIIFNYLCSLDDNSIRNRLIKKGFVVNLKKVDDEGSQRLVYSSNLRYVIGILIACEFYNQISIDVEKKDSLLKACDIIGNLNDTFLEDLKYLDNCGIRVFKNINSNLDKSFLDDILDNKDLLEIDENMLEEFRASYKKYLDNIFSNDRLNDKNLVKKL